MRNNQQIVTNIFNPFLNTFNGSILPEDDLDQVKFKIVEILSQKDNFSKENQSLKSHQTAYSELQKQNEVDFNEQVALRFMRENHLSKFWK